MASPRDLPNPFGRYRVERKLGQGGMGAVYLAVDSVLGRPVAIKVPLFGDDEEPEAVLRFYREARVAASIDHPHVCGVHDVGEIEGIHYLTMPYIEGVPLSQKISPDHPWPPRRTVELVCQLALAVDAMHVRGIIHRDLKPHNVLIRTSGDPVVMDFGLARSQNPTQHLTNTGAMLGTPAYMSPEQVLGEKTVGPGTDIYSLGVILYQLLTGQLPFPGPGTSLFGQILHAPPAPPSEVRPGLGAALDSICLKAIAKKQEERYVSMGLFAGALKEYLGLEAQIKADAAECERCIAEGKNSRVWLLANYRQRLAAWAQYAKQGMAEAQWLYGDCLLEGVGLDQDSVAATRWFLKAAEQGFALAQMSLANRYYRGEGVRKDIGKAVEWYEKAAAQGQRTARRMLERIDPDGDDQTERTLPEEESPHVKKSWWRFW